MPAYPNVHMGNLLIRHGGIRSPEGNWNLPAGDDIVSAAELSPGDGVTFDVTGSTNITSIASSAASQGRLLFLRFTGTLTGEEGQNLRLSGHFEATPGDLLYLICWDGTNFTEFNQRVMSSSSSSSSLSSSSSSSSSCNPA